MSKQLVIFLSHAADDLDHVELVRGQIAALGARVYLAEHDPQPGTPLAEKVTTAIDRSDAVIVVLTSASHNSVYVQQEIGFAKARGKLIIPIIDEAIVDKIDLGMLAGLEYLPLDLARPAEAMRNITPQVQALVMAQLQLPDSRAAKTPVSISTPTLSDSEKLMLLFAVALIAILLLGGEGGAPA